MRKSRKRNVTKAQESVMRKIAREEQFSNMESKHLVYQLENVALYHNVPKYYGTLLGTLQGTKDDNSGASSDVRVGDELILRNLNVRFWISTKSDRPNCIFKGYLIWYNSCDTLNNALVFATQQNKMIDRINKEKVSIIDSFIIRPRQNYSVVSREHSYLATLNGSWKNKKIVYDEGGSAPKKRDIAFVLVTYDAYGTLQSDNIASFAINSRLTFKDP